MKITLRKAKEDDYPELVGVYNAAIAVKNAYGDTSWDGQTPFDLEEIDGIATVDGPLYVAVNEDDTIFGAVALPDKDIQVWGHNNDNALYVNKLVVSSRHRGQGIGKQILELAAAIGKKEGRSALRLDCFDENEKLCTYYDNAGFNRFEVKYLPARDKTTQKFEKRL